MFYFFDLKKSFTNVCFLVCVGVVAGVDAVFDDLWLDINDFVLCTCCGGGV